MYIFLDESGDLGFDFANKKSSRYFIISTLVTEDVSVLKSAVKRTLKNKLRQSKKNRFIKELKGSSTNLTVKQYFYQKITEQENWFIQAIILDKFSLKNNITLSEDKHKLYNILSRSVLNGIPNSNNSSVLHLYVDRSKNNKEIKIFDAYIRSNLEHGMPDNSILNIEHLNSENSTGLQSIDMFCYGIARKYECQDDAWYKLFSERIRREIIVRF